MAKVKVINKRLLDYVIEVSANTGEVLSEEFKRDSMEVYDRGIKTRYAIVTQSRGSVKVGSFLTIILTSKMTETKSAYYQGITENTIGLIHSHLSDHKVCEFSFETLMQSECTDIDIKRDFNHTHQGFGKLTEKLEDATLCTNQLGRGVERVHNVKKEQNGIWWATRQTKTPRTNPFVKLYSKEFDLINQTRRDRIDFTKHILEGDEGKGIFRIETTIKNKDHLSSFGLTDSTLRGILSLSEDTLSNVISTNLNKHIKPRGEDIERVVCEGISPKDQETINSIMMGMHFDLPYQSIRSILMRELEGANLSKRGSRLDSLYVDHIEGSKSDESTKELEEYFDLIGWN